MTIRSHINSRELNDRFSNFENCADEAPAGAFEHAKAIRATIGQAADDLIAATRALGLKADNCDRIREVEIMLYDYLRASNPNNPMFIEAEAFGEAVNGPARERVLAQCARDTALLSLLRADAVMSAHGN